MPIFLRGGGGGGLNTIRLEMNENGTIIVKCTSHALLAVILKKIL